MQRCLRTSASLPPLVPAVHSYTDSSTAVGDFELSGHLRIIVDENETHSRRDNGLTLIPPTLLSFAQIFESDLKALFPATTTALSIGSVAELAHIREYVFLSISNSSDFTLADGSPTTEGYEMNISSDGIKIVGVGAKGAFWGTRTFLQGLVLSGGRFPSGTIRDQPDWQTRGIMLDAGRQWYPVAFLKEVCAYASWFKMSEFHVHLSDNVNPNGHFNAYARFRLHSNDPEEFDDFQRSCASRGVTVIPELESPGHALVITQWKPDLALSSDFTLINLTVPDAIPTIEMIWKEFLPWFHTKQVSIGADEYNSSLADDYNNFVNTMSNFIGEDNKVIRIWGTNEPSNKTSVSKNITIQHWEFFEDDPYELIREGYNVINSEDSVQYIVVKQSGSYPQRLNQTRLWDGANVNTGGIWDPHIFDLGNASNNPGIHNPLLRGSIMAVWNDHGPNASTFLEAFYAMKEGLPVIASANWQAASRPNHLTHEQFLSAYPVLEASAPGQNLDRRVPSRGSVVVDYELNDIDVFHSKVTDRSGNGYDAILQDGVIHTPLGSKGHNYTLLIVFGSSQMPGTLLAGPDDSFGFTQYGGGTTLAFTSSNITYPLFNYTLPIQPSSLKREIILTGTENRTSAFVDGDYVGDFLIAIDGTNVLEPMAFVAPVQRIGEANSNVERVVLWEGLQDIASISGLMEPIC
ncbi:Beta-hexosaminidase [Grifola frondosa]|uniref:beta-N-acetylhexosaminidase n=1 Tax=Grifola frondosa TaxID=5627 RepID=A0A1C7MR72_GRIFR|nr:Beta-hexosaminidase [Grifola frondosa]